MNDDNTYPELDDDDFMKKCKNLYDFFSNNRDSKPQGHRKFKYHLAAYLILRIASGMGGGYNPTNSTPVKICDQTRDVQKWPRKP